MASEKAEAQDTAGAPRTGAYRVVLCDDHEVVRRGLRELLSTLDGFEVVAEASSAAEVIATADRIKPDLVIADVRLPDASGIEACRTIRERHPETKVLMLTSYPDEDAVVAAIIAGAAGYVLKQTTGPELITAITTAAAGGSLLDQRLVSGVFERIRHAKGLDDPGLASLTDQERRVLWLVAEGKSNREVGDALGVSEKTIKNHVSHVLDKLGLHRRTEAVAYVAKRRTLE